MDNWTERKGSKEIFRDDGGLCRVLKEGKLSSSLPSKSEENHLGSKNLYQKES